ncbi:MAG: ABC transporter ATP-binding protein [Candidatus Omnitrophota bacterium]|nr:ABC transporter ATP-binding protein [Candidatus Omnitrophota bacterium]
MRDKIKLFLSRARFFLPFRKSILALFFLNMMGFIFSLASPYLSKLYIDKSFLQRNLAEFIRLTVISGVLFVISVAFGLAANFIRNRITIKVKLALAGRFIARLFSQDISFFQGHSVGENIFRLADMDKVSGFLLGQVPGFLVNAVRLPVILGICLWLHQEFTIFLILVSPAFILHSWYMRKKYRPLYEAMWLHGMKVGKKTQEIFSRFFIIKAFGWERFERRVYLRLLITGIRLGIRGFRLSVIGSLSSTFLSKAIFGAMGLYGGLLIIQGKLSLGSYTAIMIYIGQLAGLLQYFSSVFDSFVKDNIAVRRFFEVIEAEPMVKDSPYALSLVRVRGEMQCENLLFGYQPESSVLSGVNLSVPAGSWAGIVGPSGVGKTTLVNLFIRLYDPQRGRILIDGIDIRQVALVSLRTHVAVSTQEPFLFDLSIRENISYGLKGVEDARIVEAIAAVGMGEFVAQLAAGLDTVIGENAFRLSQGYKQRLALARCLVRRPDILILDEATASIDSFSEGRIFAQMRRQRQGLTTIIVSHRLFSVRDADRIYFFRPDRLIETGTHEELTQTSRQYVDFFRSQLSEDEQKKMRVGA